MNRAAAIQVIKDHLIACRDACMGMVGMLVFDALKNVPDPVWPEGCGPEPDTAIDIEAPINLDYADGLDLYIDSLSHMDQVLFDMLHTVYTQPTRCTPSWAVEALTAVRAGYQIDVAPTMMSHVKFWNDADFNQLIRGLA